MIVFLNVMALFWFLMAFFAYEDRTNSLIATAIFLLLICTSYILEAIKEKK